MLIQELHHSIKHQVLTCEDFIKTLDGKNSNSEVLQWFQAFCKHLTSLILSISRYNTELKLEKGNRDSLLLYLNQLTTALYLLINVFVKETDTGIGQTLTETRHFCKKLILSCLSGIAATLTCEDICDSSGSFIKWMDLALEKMSEVDASQDKAITMQIFNETKLLFEEVICHAMSIAQVTLSEDCKIIKGASQMVLESLESLSNEMNKSTPNCAMINLYAETSSNKLCALETKVNNAVLRLCLEVFSEYTDSLLSIDQFCALEKNKQNDAFDSLVADFDLHVDRIMQIGLFAVSCSTCVNRVVKIRSCMASLEALETELVPAFTAVLAESSNHNKNHSLILKDHWLQQAKMLQDSIYMIIDPFAFCQIVFEENQQLTITMLENIKTKSSADIKISVEKLVSYSEVLGCFIRTVVKDIQDVDVKNLKNIYADFKNVLHEIKIASDVLLYKDNVSTEDKLRVIKRCKIILNLTKRLWYCFVQKMENNIEPSTSNMNNASASKNVTDKFTVGNQFLDHLIQRGKEILKDRSVLYKSDKTENIHIKQTSIKKISLRNEKNKCMPLSKLVHLRKLSFVNILSKSESGASLQITDILNELTDMSNTFSIR